MITRALACASGPELVGWKVERFTSGVALADEGERRAATIAVFRVPGVYRAVQVFPPTRDFDQGFIHPPGAVGKTHLPAYPLVEFRRIPQPQRPMVA